MQLDTKTLAAYLSQVEGRPVRIKQVSEIGRAARGATALKAFGYGRPLAIVYQPLANGSEAVPLAKTRQVVLRRVTKNNFGRERDDDRIAETWLDFRTFNLLPHHARVCDMAALTTDGRLESAAHLRDFFLLTDFVTGSLYADDLARIRDSGICTDQDIDRARTLATYLAEIHAVKFADPTLWRRRLRDLVGHGEGIMGLTDSYPPTFKLVSGEELRRIEEAANAWRWRLKPLAHRLSQVHGDFHPFNILFRDGCEFTVLDRSRGEWGEPADDLSALTMNYLFFALQRYDKLDGPFTDLCKVFWEHYQELSGDSEISNVIQPWFAWRALVLASPQWYPTLSDQVRRALLAFARNVLGEQCFAWRQVNDYLKD
ncbi:MAG: aminoglycoside phosphotransferase family protein [Chloroflexales bacterium]|nr:aminoglycoside phosphotransferase family protein [Chloroflexales bacterium]